MAGDCPEDESERDDKDDHHGSNPDGAAQQQFLDIRLADSERTEGCCFRLAKEDKNRVELILMRDEEKNSKRKGDEKLNRRVSRDNKESLT